MENLSGTLIKGYELQERIGSGGFGAVYKAHQTTVGRQVAIKIILPGFANRPDFIRRFETEAQLIARLEHPYIVPLHDFWRDPNGAYLVMRWLRGGSLKDALQQGTFDIDAAATLMEQVTGALSAAHRNGVIHRDLKPGNILLDEDSNAYLADFGIAKDVGASGNGEITEPDQIIGSPDYLAPEQARSEPVTPHTDIYSLGVVLYEVLTGQHPFPNATGVERLFKHLNEPLPLIDGLDPDCQDALNEVIQTATQKDPARRYADALVMAAAFQQAIAARGQPLESEIIELLTLREQEILQCIIDGLTNHQIAEKLFIEQSTVKWYIKQIYKKLGVRSRVQAIVRARELNLIVPGTDNGHLTVIGGTTSTTRLPAPENPYKGLRAFQPADEQDFFGREKLTAKVIQRLNEKHPMSRFLALVGPSGSGKSSLIKAGLTPALWRGELPGSERWFIVEMLPGIHPLDELEVALMRVAANQSGSLNEQLRRDERGLVRVSQLILPNDGSELVLIVDQFEEVFTLVENEAERRHFLTLLQTAVTEKRSRVRVVVTLRADFYDRPLMYPDYGELMRARMETVLPLSAKELESVIVNPAKRAGVKFEEGLVATIISEVNYQPGALPLLQYALTELFEQRDNRTLTQAAYHQIGGTVGALAKRAEALYQEFSEQAQETVRQMFLRLVTLGEGVEDTRRRTPRSELAAISENEDLLSDVIDTFADYRLLSLDYDPATRTPTVEVAHEAILREWERLRNWLNESRADMRMQRQLGHMAEEWHQSGRDKSFLLRGSRLEILEGWIAETGLAVTPQEREFLDVSTVEHETEIEIERQRQLEKENLKNRAWRVLQGLVAVFLVATVAAGGLAFFAFGQRAVAKDQHDQAALERDTQTSLLLAALAEDELEGINPERGVLLALEALEYYPFTVQAQTALIHSVETYRAVRRLDVSGGDYGFQEDVWVARWSPDGSRIAGGGRAGPNSVVIWDYDTGNVLLALDKHAELCVNPEEIPIVDEIAWSPSGDRIATASNQPPGTRVINCGTVVWNATTGETITIISGYEEAIWSLYWSPDGTQILTGNNDGTATIRDAATGNVQLQLIGHSGKVNDAVFSPDGTRIVTVSADSTIRLWNAESGDEELRLDGHVGEVISAHWSPDGTRIVTGGSDGLPRVWDATSGEPLLVLRGHTQPVISVDWSSDGRFIATLSPFEGVTKVWDAKTGTFLFEVHGTTRDYADFSPDGTHLLTGSTKEYSTVLVRDISLRNPRFIGHTDGFEYADWSPDGKYIATSTGSSLDPDVRIWDSFTGEQINVRNLPDGGRYLDWSPDSTRIAIPHWGRIEVLNVVTNQVTPVLSVPDTLVPLSAKWSPDGTLIAGSFWDTYGQRPIYIWNVETDEILNMMYEDCMQWAAEWSPDGSQIVSSCLAYGEPGKNTPARIRDVATGEVLRTLESDHGWTLRTIWSPDGKRLLVTYEGGVAKIWDVETGEVLLTFAGHSQGVWGADWSPDGTYVVTGDTNGQVKVWNAETGEEVVSYSFNGDALNTKWSPDGTQIIIAGSGSTEPIIKRVWLSTDELIAHAYECCVTRELTLEERTQFELPER